MNRDGIRRNVELFDIWNTIKIKFTVMHPRISHNQSIRITGNIPELGNWNKIDPIMCHDEPGHNTLNNEALVPYSVTIPITTRQDVVSYGFNYSYSLWDGVNRETEWERDPARRMEVMNSDEYRGQLGNSNAY